MDLFGWAKATVWPLAVAACTPTVTRTVDVPGQMNERVEMSSDEAKLVDDMENQEPVGASAEKCCEYWKYRVSSISNDSRSARWYANRKAEAVCAQATEQKHQFQVKLSEAKHSLDGMTAEISISEQRVQVQLMTPNSKPVARTSFFLCRDDEQFLESFARWTKPGCNDARTPKVELTTDDSGVATVSVSEAHHKLYGPWRGTSAPGQYETPNFEILVGTKQRSTLIPVSEKLRSLYTAWIEDERSSDVRVAEDEQASGKCTNERATLLNSVLVKLPNALSRAAPNDAAVIGPFSIVVATPKGVNLNISGTYGEQHVLMASLSLAEKAILEVKDTQGYPAADKSPYARVLRSVIGRGTVDSAVVRTQMSDKVQATARGSGCALVVSVFKPL